MQVLPPHRHQLAGGGGQSTWRGDVRLRDPPSEGTLGVITPLLLCVDYFTLSLEEAAYIPSSDDPIEVATFFALGVQTCVQKDGVRSLYLIRRDSVQRVPDYVLRASDFMGSGDAYSGSFIELWCVACGRWRGALVVSGLGSDADVMDWRRV